jgi:hypothetical protein
MYMGYKLCANYAFCLMYPGCSCSKAMKLDKTRLVQAGCADERLDELRRLADVRNQSARSQMHSTGDAL